MSFSGLVLTRNGRKEMMKAVDGESLSFTHIIFGDGSTTELYNLKENVSNEICRLPITEVERQENKIILSLDYTNKSFPKGFYFRELGVLGNGKLCYYDNSGADAEYIDPDAESISKEKRLRIEIIVSDEVKIETTAVGGLYVLENPSYEMAEELVELTSGEKMKTALGKIAKAISSLITHLADKVSHITATERTAWNSKAEGNHTHNYAGSSSAGGSATSAVKLQNARTIRTNLASTSTASFDGTANVTPGVAGVLPVANGGTGQTTLNAGMNSFINSLDVGTAVPKGEAYFVSQDADGGTLNTYFRRPISKIWDYIKNQMGTKGSATQPVYMNAGVPTACTYTLNKSVPSDAKFTDTVYTHPTSSGNKHIPSGGSSGKLLRWNSDGTAEWSGATNGSTTQPIYMNAGVPTACTYTLNKSVPSNAVFTDTNTWRPVQNNLTSTSTSDCLSAYQGKLLNDRVATLEKASTTKLTNNSYIKKKGNVVSFYSYGGASTTSALNSIKLESTYRPPYPIHIAGYLCKVGATSRYPAYLSIGSDGVIGVYYMQQEGGAAISHNGTDYWFDGNGTWLV